MLTDIKLRNLKPEDKLYRVTDQDGLYVAVLTSDAVSFRCGYSISGGRETLTLERYGIDGISLAKAREKLHTAKELLRSGVSPAAGKRYGKNKLQESETLAVYTGNYMKHVALADNTRAMREVVIKRDILPMLGNKLMTEVITTMVHNLCDRVIDRGGNIAAVQVRKIVSSIYRYANDQGHCFSNPAQDIKASSIATFTPRLRSLSPREVGMLFSTLDTVAGMPTLKLALGIIFLTMVCESKFTLATWDEADFRANEWTIPAGRMKGGRTHVIYLPRQVNNLLIDLEMCAGGSPYLLAGCYNISKPLSNAALSDVIATTVKVAQSQGKALGRFTVHGIRRTTSTLLHETGYPSGWVEECLAHEQKGVRAVHNKAECVWPRTYMPQQWANVADS